MTILAGIVSRTRGVSIPPTTRSALRQLLSRNPTDSVHELGATDWVMVKVDIGAFGTPALCDGADGASSMLCGEPLLELGSEHGVRDRAIDLNVLHEAIQAADWSAFAKATGTHCGAHFDRTSRSLTLFTDKIGLRPIYYWSNEQFVVYASAIRILEGLAEVPKRMDLRGVTEISCFGFPLAERTAYQDIKTIMAGEIVQFSDRRVESVRYWRWDRLAALELVGPNLAKEAHRRFLRAVERRTGTTRSEVAFLSGGLDSRTIVAALRGLGVDVHSINFAPRETQDEVFAAQAAAVLGTTHHYLGKRVDRILDMEETYNQSAVSAWFDSHAHDEGGRARRRCVWSGDGGSVAVGHVYLSPKVTQLAQSGATEAAIDEFCRYNMLRISTKLFHADVSEFVASVPKNGVRDELARLDCSDRGRAFHLFLMMNDQRRHLFDFYENIDLGRFEFQLPFFDSSFLELILASPVDGFLGHSFYMQWLACFPSNATSVPWQTYRGHEPCPLPVPDGLGYQWERYYDRATRRRMRLKLADQVDRVFARSGFPDRIINKLHLRMATLLTRFGIRDYSYLIQNATVYGRYWRICEATSQGSHQSTNGRGEAGL